MADGQRVNERLLVLSHVEESGPFGRTQPLMAVTCGVGRTEFVKVQGDHPDAVSSIEQHVHAFLLKPCDQGFVRHQQPGRAGNGVEHRQSRVVRNGVHHRLNHLVLMLYGERDVDRHNVGAPALCDEVDGVPACLVGVVRNEDFIAGFEPQGTQHRVHARRGVLDQGKVLGIAGQEVSKSLASGVKNARHQVLKKPDRLVFHQILPPALVFSDGGWCCTKRPVVQENTVSIKCPQTGVWTALRLFHGVQTNAVCLEVNGRKAYGSSLDGNS